MESTAALSLFADRCILGGIHEPRRVASARLEVREGLFAAVTEMSRARFESEKSQAVAIDLGDRLVAPAFVNGHAHLAMNAFRGLQDASALAGNVIEDLYYRLESGLTAADVRAFARMGAYESLLAGVGSVFDHYYHGVACAEALMDVGMTGVIAPTLQDVVGPGVGQAEAQLDATEQIDASARFSDAGVFAAVGPHATDTVSISLWREAVALATRRTLPVHAHVAQSFEELTRCHERHGTSPIGWLAAEGILAAEVPWLLVHVIHATRADLARLAPDRHVLGFCPYSQMEFCFPAPIAAWSAAGLRWLVGTDCAPSNDSMDVQKELRLVSGLHAFRVTFSPAYRTFREHPGVGYSASLDRLRRKTVSETRELRRPSALLDHVWSIPGSWHPRLRCGAIEPDRWANLLILDPDHPHLWPAPEPWRALTMANVAPAIQGMVVAGRFIGERGNFHQSIVDSDGYRAARQEANERLTAHLRRVR